MKKFLYFSLAALMLIAITSCDKTEPHKKKPVEGDGVTPVPEAVDLGIVVRGKNIKWASLNLGAENYYDYGDWYAWGETIPYYSSIWPLVWIKRNETDESTLRYNWESYIYANGSKNKLTKYCPDNEIDGTFWDIERCPEGPDGLTALLPDDDPVRQRLGGKWRMPTWEEFDALMQTKGNEDYEWKFKVRATDEEGNELSDCSGNRYTGLRITRLSTGASIYLPAAGLSGYDNTYPIGFYCASWGFYWSSTLDTEAYSNRENLPSPQNARAFHFDQNERCISPGWVWRCYGMSIRPVTE
ncbi:MAG: hypothetical protein IK045_08010 [Bacteroidales bacterium]|nr:hypothetical protein [Bacteroidales bacterium]